MFVIYIENYPYEGIVTKAKIMLPLPPPKFWTALSQEEEKEEEDKMGCKNNISARHFDSIHPIWTKFSMDILLDP